MPKRTGTKAAGYTPKLWTWLTNQEVQLTVAWMKLYLQQLQTRAKG
jgi:hypothetical protein